MHCVIITSSTNTSGGTRQAAYQAEALRLRGHEVSLCLPEASEMWELDPKPYWKAIANDHRQWRVQVEALLPDARTPAIVHAFHNRALKKVSWWGLLWHARRVACVAHRGVIFRPGNPLPYLSPGLKAVLPNSQACARMLAWHCPPWKITVIQNAVPASRLVATKSRESIRAELGLSPDMVLFCSTGNDNKAKGGDTLLQAFAAANCPNAHLVMLGFTPEAFQGLADSLGVGERVSILGRTELVSSYLNASEAFLFPSRDMDSSPNTLIEAICMGLPVAACAVGGVPELVADNGLLVAPDTPQALAQAIHTLATEPQQRTRWSAASHAMRERFSTEHRALALEALYAKVLGLEAHAG